MLLGLFSCIGCHIVSIHCVVTDICAIAAWLHQELMSKALMEPEKPSGDEDADKKKGVLLLTQEFLFGVASSNLIYMQHALTVLDGLLQHGLTRQIEEQGWQLPTSIEMLRSWARNMGCVSGLAQTHLLKHCLQCLQEDVTFCAAKTPPWQASFKGGKLLIEQAIRSLRDRTKQVISGHNRCHKCLADLSLLGTRLNLQPRVQANDITSTGVLVALNCLTNASVAHVICKGIDYLIENKDKANGHKLAADFLEKNDTEKNSEVPRAFFSFFKDWSQQALPSLDLSILAPPPCEILAVKTESTKATSTPLAGEVKVEMAETSSVAGESAGKGVQRKTRGLKRLRTGAGPSAA